VDKVKLGVHPFLYPMPVVLIGANVGGRPNFMVCTYCGIVQHDPPMISVSLNRRNYTNRGIRENNTFSLNIPPCSMVQIVDHCGIVSGRSEDKSGLFATFYGVLQTAPMIEECPLNVECRVERTLDLTGTNEVFIGQVVQAYAEEKYLTNNVPDMAKMDPLLFSIYENTFWSAGDLIGHAWQIGRTATHPPRD
jgi:flavin reductase (DIM6/NTAB) family NADH-FMN oxidoreductase RutF